MYLSVVFRTLSKFGAVQTFILSFLTLTNLIYVSATYFLLSLLSCLYLCQSALSCVQLCVSDIGKLLLIFRSRIVCLFSLLFISNPLNFNLSSSRLFAFLYVQNKMENKSVTSCYITNVMYKILRHM